MTYEERIARIERVLTGRVSVEGTLAERATRVEKFADRAFTWRRAGAWGKPTSPTCARGSSPILS